VSDRYDNPSWEGDPDGDPDELGSRGEARAQVEETVVLTESETGDLLDRASENVLDGWPDPLDERLSAEGVMEAERAELTPETSVHAHHDDVTALAEPDVASAEHAPGELVVPPGYAVLEGFARGERRAVGVVVSRFNGDVTTRLLASALEELEARSVAPDAITVMPVPGAFELPLAAMALAKTRRFACIVALGCVIRGDTPHFDYVASEAASGLQLAAIETGVPVAFGVLTLDRADQAEHRVQKGAEAVQTALEMADLFANLRAAASR
jgi:6,7-dimethyl-8-ribityllumazine synthase